MPGAQLESLKLTPENMLDINTPIHAEMESTASDLLVIGAGAPVPGGHIGKVALHQIGYERYPVFMLRTE